MDRKRKMTRMMICDSLKTLMHKHPFEKITIKMITDSAGVIRPTFYNYFYDKYEVLETILTEEVIDKVQLMFDQKMYEEGIKLLFVSMKNDETFYRKAFLVDGQNSFEKMLEKHLFQIIMTVLESAYIPPATNNQMISRSLVARHYSISLASMLQAWICGEFRNFNTDDMVEAFMFILTHKITDFVHLD